MAKRKKKAAADDALRCTFGNTTDPETQQAPGYVGPDHCAACYAETQRLSAGFADGADTGDPPATGDTGESRPAHLARCADPDCGIGVVFRPFVSGAGFVILDRQGVPVDTLFGVGDAGLPVCPHGHGEMRLEDEQLVPAVQAITQAAAAANGHGTAPTQAQLFELAQPFNFEGAWLEIENKQAEIDELATVYEDDAATAKKSKKLLEEAQTLLGRMINTYHDRRLKKLREQVERAERVAPAPGDTAEDAAMVTEVHEHADGAVLAAVQDQADGEDSHAES